MTLMDTYLVPTTKNDTDEYLPPRMTLMNTYLPPRMTLMNYLPPATQSELQQMSQIELWWVDFILLFLMFNCVITKYYDA